MTAAEADREVGRPLPGFAAMVGGQAAALLAGFATSIVIVRTIGAEGRGTVALFSTATFLAAGIASSGMEGAMARVAGERGTRLAASMALWWWGVGALVVGLVWAAVGAAAAGYWHLDAGTAAILAGVGMPAVLAMSLLRGALLGGAGYRHVATGRAIFGCAGLAITATIATTVGLSAPGAIAAAFAGVALQSVYHWRRGGSPAALSRPAPQERRAQLAFAARGSSGTLLLAIQNRYDLLIVGALLSVADAGVYAVLLSLAELMLIPIDVAALVVLGSAAGGRHTTTQALTAMRLVLAMSIVMAVVLAVVGHPLLLHVFGEEFAAGYAALLLLLPGLLSLAMWRIAANDAAGRGFPELQVRGGVVGAGLVLTLVPLAAPWLGLEGAAAASSIGYIASCILILSRYRRRFDVSSRDFWRLTRQDAALVRYTAQGLARRLRRASLVA